MQERQRRNLVVVVVVSDKSTTSFSSSALEILSLLRAPPPYYGLSITSQRGGKMQREELIWLPFTRARALGSTSACSKRSRSCPSMKLSCGQPTAPPSSLPPTIRTSTTRKPRRPLAVTRTLTRLTSERDDGKSRIGNERVSFASISTRYLSAIHTRRVMYTGATYGFPTLAARYIARHRLHVPCTYPRTTYLAEGARVMCGKYERLIG